MALVGVEHLGMDTEGAQRLDPADPEDDLLTDAVLDIAAVEPVGDPLRFLAVAGYRGVEQVQRHPSDVDPPDRHGEVFAGHVEADHLAGVDHRQPVRVLRWKGLELPAVGVQRLVEVALAIQQPDRHQRQAEVAGRLEMIAGEHPETAGVLLQGLRQTELGREVGDRLERAVAVLEPARFVDRLAELTVERRDLIDERRVGGERGPSFGADQFEQADRVAAGESPAEGIEAGEQGFGALVPGPAKVGREPGERLQGGGYGRFDPEPMDRLHGARP